ncbi:MAG: hypothetical protein ABIO43_12750 [Sphingomicrobium sp.]
MPPADTIKTLLATAAAPALGDPGLRKRQLARVAWVVETSDKFLAAGKQRDDRCTEAVDRLSEADFNRLFEAEEAKVKAISEQLDAVAERDEWPRELHFTV